MYITSACLAHYVRWFAGLLGFPPKELQYRFLCQFTPVFYIRQRDYSKAWLSSLAISVPLYSCIRHIVFITAILLYICQILCCKILRGRLCRCVQSVAVAPFIINYSGCIFREYPGPWQVFCMPLAGWPLL